MARPYDPPIAEVEQDGRAQLRTVEQRLRTLAVLKAMYGENETIKEAEAYLVAADELSREGSGNVVAC
jgi:hypothetical protein